VTTTGAGVFSDWPWVFASNPHSSGCDTYWIAVAGPGDTSQARGDGSGCPAARKGIGNDILWEAEQGDAPLGQHFAERRWGSLVTLLPAVS